MRTSPATSLALAAALSAAPLGAGLGQTDAPSTQAGTDYADRATRFVEKSLDGDFSAALEFCSERFKSDIGEKGLAAFRDFVARHGEAQFVPQFVGVEDGDTVVVGVLALSHRRTMTVHVLFRGGRVDHLFQRWGRR